MSGPARFPHGTEEWFDMVGDQLRQAAAAADLPADLNWSLVERYTDGAPLPDGRVQGLRFEISDGAPVFRAGVGLPGDGDVLVELDSDAARTLNRVHLADPSYEATIREQVRDGRLRIHPPGAAMPDWLTVAHDAIVDRTA